MRRNDLRRCDHAKAQRGERVAHFEQGVVHGAVAEYGYKHGRGVRPAQGAHALKARPGYAAAVDREEHEQTVVGRKRFCLGAHGDVGAGIGRVQIFREETGDTLRAARGAEEIQVQVARMHSMASQFQIAYIVTKTGWDCNALEAQWAGIVPVCAGRRMARPATGRGGLCRLVV